MGLALGVIEGVGVTVDVIVAVLVDVGVTETVLVVEAVLEGVGEKEIVGLLEGVIEGVGELDGVREEVGSQHDARDVEPVLLVM